MTDPTPLGSPDNPMAVHETPHPAGPRGHAPKAATSPQHGMPNPVPGPVTDPVPSSRPEFAASGTPPVKRDVVKVGEERVKAVKKLAADLAPLAAKHDFKVGTPTTFGLELDVFDPHTGLLFSAAQAGRRDFGVPESLMTPEEVVHTVTAARTHAQTAGLVRFAPTADEIAAKKAAEDEAKKADSHSVRRVDEPAHVTR